MDVTLKQAYCSSMLVSTKTIIKIVFMVESSGNFHILACELVVPTKYIKGTCVNYALKIKVPVQCNFHLP
jgi:hypothetical protein